MTKDIAQQFIDWIAANLDKKSGKTQTGLAEALGIAHPQITQLLKGKRDLKVREVPVIAKYLNAAPPAWPDEITGKITGDAEILRSLSRIQGLDQRGVEVVFSVIDTVIDRQIAKSEQSSSDDQSEPSTLHHASKP